MALRLFAICNFDDQQGPGPGLPDGARLLHCRDLGAVVGDAAYAAGVPDEAAIAVHRRVVDAVFAKGEMLPAPPGVVFRSDTALQRWMELHYVTLSDALAFVADRVGARVHVSRQGGDADAEAGTDLAATSAEVMRSLRRRAVAAVSLRREHTTGIDLGAAFLVERSLWREFHDEAKSVREGFADVQVEVTGPWPPYDFVRIEFGG